ncbi:MAG TPA: phosphotransferase, partial [Roseiflexaceae bacterium]|nr:phosphotransferase [Roseiflexaceae bacterium]
ESLPAQPKTTAALGNADWNWIVPELRLALVTLPDEAELPSLPRLVDAEQSRALLETALRAASPVYADLQLESCTPRVVRYKPGSRCTILYDLVYPPGANADGRWPDLVAVKTYKGNKGRNAYEGMRSLWDSPFRTDSHVTIAEPLAYVAELNAFIQGPLREQQALKDVIRSAVQLGTPEALAELGDLMRKTARGLAALHSSGLRFGTETTWADEFGDLEETCEQLSSVVPTLNDTLASLTRFLSRRAADAAADPLVTTHGSFRPAQVLLYEEQLSFIDFDSVGLAEPALDLALFLTATKNIGLSEPHEEESNEDDTALEPAERERILNQLDGIGEEFLREYERHAPISRTRLEVWEGLNLLALVVSCWTKIKPVRLANTLLMLERYLERVGGLRAA